MVRASRSTSKSKPSKTKKPQVTKMLPSRTRNKEKSKYFGPDTDERDSSFDDDELEPHMESESALSETDEDEPPRKKSKVTPKKATKKDTPKKHIAKGRLSKRGREVSEDEGPWETFIPKEDTPEAGDVPYQDETIHPNTMQFLKGSSS